MLNELLNLVVLALTLNFEKNKTPVPHGPTEILFYAFMYSWCDFCNIISHLSVLSQGNVAEGTTPKTQRVFEKI